MSTYGLRYSNDFDSKATSYTLEIYQKDYAGAVIPIKGASSSVVHSYQTDDPTSPIKGSSISVNLINEGNLPLNDFYSEDNEEFKAVLIWHSTNDITLFEGFLVQDDSSELMVDFNHEINLAANDNLGLLKDIPFNEARSQPLTLDNTFTTEFAEGSGVNTISINPNVGVTIQVNDTMVISISNVDGTYNVVSITPGLFVYDILVREPVTIGAPVSTATIEVYTPDYYTLRSLNSFIKSCLLSTGLSLDTHEFVNINEVSQDDNDCFFDQTLLDPQTFNTGNGWDNTYMVLKKILERFDCTLFQAKGKWNIIRWPELKDFGYSIPGFLYDSDFVYQNVVYLNETTTGFTGWDKFLIGINETSQSETGLRQRITSPYKFTKETFNYKKPEIPRNADLMQTGALLNTSTTGSGVTLQTINEYEALWWDNQTFFSIIPAVYFIRVITDYLGNEIERYLVLVGGAVAGLAMSSPISANAGDGFKLTFQTRTTESIPGGALQTYMLLDDGVQPFQSYVGGEQTGFPTVGDWIVSSNGWTLYLDSPDDTIDWHSVNIEAVVHRVPFDGLLYFVLGNNTQNAGFENHYKDIRLEYLFLINESTKIIGHTHTSDKRTLTKNINEREISIDASPRNSIAGTLFLNSITGVLQDRCGQWVRKPRIESKNLGDIITEETLFLRRIPRTLLEGKVYGLLSVPQDAGGLDIVDHLSILTLCRYTLFTDKNFIFGRMDIDYKNDNASGTLYEMYQDGEVDGDLIDYYNFQYLYDIK